MFLCISPEVAQALSEGRGVVALESTIITHGMPFPSNLETAQIVESVVRENGAVPATIALMHGRVKIGLTGAELELLAREGKSAHKVSRRDIPSVLASGALGSTTVAATMLLASMAKIRIFATGGIGGVHRGSDWDISADITELGRTPVLVVCAGAKSVLDLPRTVELLETAGVNVMGWKTSEFPAFFTPHSGGLPTASRVDSEAEVAKILRAHLSLGLQSGLLLACPIPAEFKADSTSIELATSQALKEAEGRVRGRDITPFLLSRIQQLTGGASLKANIALVKNNAAIAARVANATATRKQPRIIVIGGICVDTIAKPGNVSVSGETKTSSIGTVVSSVGGVDRNIAAVICQLETNGALLVAPIGSDVGSFAHTAVLHDGNKFGWSLIPIQSCTTATYTAILNGDGTLCSAVIEDKLFDNFNPSLPTLGTCPHLISANLSLSTIAAICSTAKGPVWADCVSTNKCGRLRASLSRLSLVKANIDELSVLTGKPVSSNIIEYISESLESLTCSFLVTCGKSGLVVLVDNSGVDTAANTLGNNSSLVQIRRHSATVTSFQAPTIEHVVDCTGAGDCLMGATAWAHFIRKRSLIESVVFGIAASRLTLMSTQAVSPEIKPELMVSRL